MEQQSDRDDAREAIHNAEQRVQDTYTELGVVGEKRGEQVYAEEVARGELSRGEREMERGEFGPKAYEREDVVPPSDER